MTNLSYIAGTTQTCYKLIQEASGHIGAKAEFGQLMWKRFQETTSFQKVVEDVENAFSKVKICSSLVSFQIEKVTKLVRVWYHFKKHL